MNKEFQIDNEKITRLTPRREKSVDFQTKVDALVQHACVCQEKARILDDRADILSNSNILFSSRGTKRTARQLKAKANSLRYKAEIYRSRALALSQAELVQFKIEGGYLN